MPCNASYARFIFGKFFTSTIILYILLFAQFFFILAKSGCYTKLIKDMGFQLDFNSLTHLVQKLTSYEQRHPDIYQDKFKHQITLVDTEDAKDSGEEQEVAVVEWTRGANPVSCKWVK
jgi:hypothetical protein